MAYTPIVWATGDIITAEKLNGMQHGAVIVNPAASSYSEVKALFDAGNVVLLSDAQTENSVITYLMTGYAYTEGLSPNYKVYIAQPATEQLPDHSYYAANTADGALTLQIPD